MKKAFGIILLVVGIPLFLLFFIPLMAAPFMDDKPAGFEIALALILAMISGGLLFPAYKLLTSSAAERFAEALIIEAEGNLEDKIRSFLAENPRLSLAALRRIGNRLYAKLLGQHVEDLEITKDELAELRAVASEFQLSPEAETKVKKKYAKPAIEKISNQALSDHVVEGREREKIYELAEILEVSRETVDNILKKQALGIFKDYHQKAVSDRRLTPNEEAELGSILTNLGLSTSDLSTRDQEQLTYYKLLWEVENGILPEMDSPIILQKNEVCHLAIPAERLENKVVTVGRTTSSSGVSIKLAKGVRYRVGASRSRPIKQEVTHRYPGTLCITNRRVVFQAPAKGFTTPLRSIISLESYSNGVELQKGATTYLFQFRHAEIVPMILTALVNKL